MNVINSCDLVVSFSVDWILVRGAVLVILVALAEQFRKMAVTLVRSTSLSSWNDSVPTGRIFIKIWYVSIFRKSRERKL
jgi:hypothetical protein